MIDKNKSRDLYLPITVAACKKNGHRTTSRKAQFTYIGRVAVADGYVPPPFALTVEGPVMIKHRNIYFHLRSLNFFKT